MTDEPHSNSPADAGYIDQQDRPRQHTPKKCRSCGAGILWAQLLDEKGHRIALKGGKFKAIPIDWNPNPNGKVVVFERPGQGFVCRILRRGEGPPPGARLRTAHKNTCPQVKAWKDRRKPWNP